MRKLLGHQKIKPMNRLLISLFLIIFEAVSEDSYDRKKKTIAGVIEFIYRAVGDAYHPCAWLTNYWHIDTEATDYWVTASRICYASLCYLLTLYTASLEVIQVYSYIGNTKLYERVLVWLLNKGKVSYSLLSSLSLSHSSGVYRGSWVAHGITR